MNTIPITNKRRLENEDFGSPKKQAVESPALRVQSIVEKILEIDKANPVLRKTFNEEQLKTDIASVFNVMHNKGNGYFNKNNTGLPFSYVLEDTKKITLIFDNPNYFKKRSGGNKSIYICYEIQEQNVIPRAIESPRKCIPTKEHPSVGRSPMNNIQSPVKQTIVSYTKSRALRHTFYDVDFTRLRDESFACKLQFMLLAVEGIENLHKENLIHRDIKLNNLFYKKSDNKVSVGDLDSVGKYEKGNLVWTLGYAAPFDIKNQCNSKEGDMFAFGVCLERMFNKELAYETQNPAVQGLQSLINELKTKTVSPNQSASYAKDKLHSILTTHSTCAV